MARVHKGCRAIQAEEEEEVIGKQHTVGQSNKMFLQ
jgi:hypothetical protein